MVGDRNTISQVALATVVLSIMLIADSPVFAAILFLAGSDEPQYVLTIREEAAKIVVGIPAADGTFAERVYNKSDVDDFVRTVSAERLAELSPEKPAAYRDYAEELAAKKIDPDARAAAIRLYLIAAHLDSERLGRSSLLGMTALARSPDEERRFRAMTYLLDPKHDAGSLAPRADSARSEAADDIAQRDELLTALRTLRQGKGHIAERMADRASLKAAFARWGRNFSHEDFLDACKSSEPLAGETLARILYLELELTGGAVARTSSSVRDEPDSSDGRGRPSYAVNWSAAITAGQTAPVPTLSLETLTEFDPAKCVFRDGKWVSAAK